jgi:hypothetical protein
MHSLWIIAALMAAGAMPVIAADQRGAPVPNAPAPETVELKGLQQFGGSKTVRVGNSAGDYTLVCNLSANDLKAHAIKSCLSPRPQQQYLLFRENTKWLINGANGPISLQFMQDWTVSYTGKENVGLLPMNDLGGFAEDRADFGVYWLSSWTPSGR